MDLDFLACCMQKPFSASSTNYIYKNAVLYVPFSASIVCSLCLADSIAMRSRPCTFMSSATIEPPPASGRSGVGSVPFGRGAAESPCCDRGRSMSAVSSVGCGGNGAEGASAEQQLFDISIYPHKIQLKLHKTGFQGQIVAMRCNRMHSASTSCVCSFVFRKRN